MPDIQEPKDKNVEAVEGQPTVKPLDDGREDVREKTAAEILVEGERNAQEFQPPDGFMEYPANELTSIDGHLRETATKMATEISDRYIGQIPKEDRQIDNLDQLKMLADYFSLTQEATSHRFADNIFASGARVQYHPRFWESRQEYTALMKIKDPEARKEEERAIDTRNLEAKRKFVDDPTGPICKETPFLKELFESPLPESIRQALLSIALKEGPNSPLCESKLRVREADLARLGQEESEEFKKITSSVEKIFPRENRIAVDKVRKRAAGNFLESVYPFLVEDPQIKFVVEMMSDFSRSNPSAERDFCVYVDRFAELTGSKEYDDYKDEDYIKKRIKDGKEERTKDGKKVVCTDKSEVWDGVVQKMQDKLLDISFKKLKQV